MTYSFSFGQLSHSIIYSIYRIMLLSFVYYSNSYSIYYINRVNYEVEIEMLLGRTLTHLTCIFLQKSK